MRCRATSLTCLHTWVPLMTSWTSPPCMPQPGRYADLVSQSLPQYLLCFAQPGRSKTMLLSWLKAQPDHDQLWRMSVHMIKSLQTQSCKQWVARFRCLPFCRVTVMHWCTVMQSMCNPCHSSQRCNHKFMWVAAQQLH